MDNATNIWTIHLNIRYFAGGVACAKLFWMGFWSLDPDINLWYIKTDFCCRSSISCLSGLCDKFHVKKKNMIQKGRRVKPFHTVKVTSLASSACDGIFKGQSLKMYSPGHSTACLYRLLNSCLVHYSLLLSVAKTDILSLWKLTNWN